MRGRTLPLYARLFRLHARLLLAIAGSIMLFEMFMVWVSAQMGGGRGFALFLEQILPPDMQHLIYDQFGVGSFEGLVAFGFQHPMFLVAVVAFVLAAATVPAAERETGFMDLVLARPVPRGAYLLATLLLVITGAVILPVAILTGVGIGLATVDAVPPELTWVDYIPAAAALAQVLLAVGGIGLLAAVSAHRRGPAIGRAVGLVLVFYWLDFVGPLWSLLETARWISPFAYFDPAGAVSAGVGVVDTAVLLAVFGATAGGAFLEFGWQDL